MRKVNFLFPIYLAKIVAAVSRLFNLGAGSTWPGHLAFEQDKQILSWLVSQLKGGVILIAGTNGKTTTSKMIRTILEHGLKKKVVHNEAGANLLNGIVSSLIMATDWRGRIKADWGVFEVDEATLPLALNEFTPKVVVLLNLFRDQLDRYGEVDLIAQKWHKALIGLPRDCSIVLNADDPQIAFLGDKLKARVFYFGLEDSSVILAEKQHAMDSSFCPRCAARLKFEGIYFSHLGHWLCSSCALLRPKVDLSSWDYPLVGIYNRYNTLAAVLVARILGVKDNQIKQSLKDFHPAFGRLEEIAVEGKKIRVLLSKNPTGFNESIRTLNEFPGKKTVLLVLNDQIPDGRDVSWIWDVDFEELGDVGIITSGDRAYDMGLRIKYALQTQNYSSKVKIKEDLKEAIKEGLEAAGDDETLYILPTYSAMLEVREIIAGRKIL